MLSSPHKAVNKEKIKPMLQDGVNYCPIDFNQDIIPQILRVCYELNIQSIIVEGGAKTLQSFIDAGMYDEVRIITNTEMRIGEGLNAPTFSGNKVREFKIMSDLVQIYKN